MKRCFVILSMLISLTLLSFVSGYADELKVVTINVWSGLDYEGTFKMGEYESKEVRKGRYLLLIEELESLDPDVIGINEANLLPGYARRLARDLDMDFVYSVGMGGIHFGCFGIPVNFREGDAILAKRELNLKSIGKKRLSGKGVITNFFTFHFTESNQVIGCVIEFAGREVYIFNTHTHASPPNEPWFMERLGELNAEGVLTDEELKEVKEGVLNDQQWRREEIEGLLTWIDKEVPPGAPIILIGDFNAEVDTDEMSQVIEYGFVDTFRVMNPELPGYTWDPETNLNILTYYSRDIEGLSPNKVADRSDDFVQKRLDFIFIGGTLTDEDIIESRVVLDRESGGQHPADHYGVLSVIEID